MGVKNGTKSYIRSKRVFVDADLKDEPPLTDGPMGPGLFLTGQNIFLKIGLNLPLFLPLRT
jgi:hypothetical protein